VVWCSGYACVRVCVCGRLAASFEDALKQGKEGIDEHQNHREVCRRHDNRFTNRYCGYRHRLELSLSTSTLGPVYRSRTFVDLLLLPPYHLPTPTSYSPGLAKLTVLQTNVELPLLDLPTLPLICICYHATMLPCYQVLCVFYLRYCWALDDDPTYI
jgi:hypothetical protein